MKKKIDIEKLLQWAMRDEMPKGRPISDDLGRVIADRFRHRPLSLSSGARPDIDTLGYAPGSPHEDAEAVADAVARLPTSAKFEAVADVEKLFGSLLPVAGPAVRALTLKTFNPQALVVGCAIGAKRPRWDFTPTCSQIKAPFRDKAGALRSRPLVEGLDDAGATLVPLKPNRGKAAMTRGVYDLHRAPRSPLHWSTPALLSIGEARAEYFAWQFHLAALARTLRASLIEYEPIAPAAGAFPWIDGEKRSRVLSDGFPAGLLTVPLALGPTRAAAEKPFETQIEVLARHGQANYRRARIAKSAAAQA
jgi:hypothetical protein